MKAKQNHTQQAINSHNAQSVFFQKEKTKQKLQTT